MHSTMNHAPGAGSIIKKYIMILLKYSKMYLITSINGMLSEPVCRNCYWKIYQKTQIHVLKAILVSLTAAFESRDVHLSLANVIRNVPRRNVPRVTPLYLKPLSSYHMKSMCKISAEMGMQKHKNMSIWQQAFLLMSCLSFRKYFARNVTPYINEMIGVWGHDSALLRLY